MKPAEKLDRLRRAFGIVSDVDPDLGAWLRRALALVEGGSARSIDAALGITGRGRSSLSALARLERRDAHLRAAWDLTPFSERTTTADRLRDLSEALTRFECTTWRWSRDRAEPPERLSARQVELWHALRCGPCPTSTQQLGRIVAKK